MEKRFWRIVSLCVLAVALLGPWTFERIHVPEKYACNSPFIRLEGDFCGEPMSGAWLFGWLAEGLIYNLTGLVTGTVSFANRTREFMFMFIWIFPLLPLLSTPVAIWKKDSRRLQIFNLATWGLAVILGLYWSAGMIYEPNPHKWRLWGGWLYMGLAVSVLMMEVIALTAIRKEKHKP